MVNPPSLFRDRTHGRIVGRGLNQFEKRIGGINAFEKRHSHSLRRIMDDYAIPSGIEGLHKSINGLLNGPNYKTDVVKAAPRRPGDCDRFLYESRLSR